MSDDVVLVQERAAGGGRRIGIATLNAPAALNSLSLAMVRRLDPALQAWAQDPQIACVVLLGAGEKAFCAGGDLRELYQSMRDCADGPNAYAQGFFSEEYRLDHRIHTYPKPLLCWGHGIVMGGGIGLMAGCSHRVVTGASRLAMPEIGIGLYPDVGGSWFLRRMPGRTGLFLALTGAPLNAADALFCGLADVHIAASHRDALLQSLTESDWPEGGATPHAQLARLLQAQASVPEAASRVRQHYDTIQALMAGDDLRDIAARLRALQSDDAWLQQAGANFTKGSPSSAALAWELWQRVHHMSLAEVFRLELHASLGCCAHPDFAEGIRALLIDKDKTPRWTPATVEEVTPAWIDAHFAKRFDGPHPLADLT